MAFVKLNNNIKDEIVSNVGRLYRHDYNKLIHPPYETPPAIGEYLYDFILTEERSKKLVKLLPNWARLGVYGVGVVIEGYELYAPFMVERLSLHEHNTSFFDVPGVRVLGWNHGVMTLYDPKPEEMQSPELADFVKTLLAHKAGKESIDEAKAKAEADVRKLLDNHTTLQGAVRQMGPALLSFCGAYLREAYNMAPCKSFNSKSKKEKVDLDYLIVKVGNQAIGLDS